MLHILLGGKGRSPVWFFGVNGYLLSKVWCRWLSLSKPTAFDRPIPHPLPRGKGGNTRSACFRARPRSKTGTGESSPHPVFGSSGFRGVRATLVVAPHWAGTRPARTYGVNPLNSQRAFFNDNRVGEKPNGAVD